MEFLDLQTVKGEALLVNIDYVMLITDSKRGIFVVTNDGNSFYCSGDYFHLRDIVLNREKK